MRARGRAHGEAERREEVATRLQPHAACGHVCKGQLAVCAERRHLAAHAHAAPLQRGSVRTQARELRAVGGNYMRAHGAAGHDVERQHERSPRVGKRRRERGGGGGCGVVGRRPHRARPAREGVALGGGGGKHGGWRSGGRSGGGHGVGRRRGAGGRNGGSGSGSLGGCGGRRARPVEEHQVEQRRPAFLGGLGAHRGRLRAQQQLLHRRHHARRDDRRRALLGRRRQVLERRRRAVRRLALRRARGRR